jgi:hypothetical protein
MCYWDHWQPATLKFCEEMLCGPIRQPANAFSNIGFIFAGLWILFKESKNPWSPYKLMGIAAISIGITSGVYHASMTFFWQFFDVSSMFMLILLALCFNLVRNKLINPERYTLVYSSLLITSMVLMLLLKGPSGEYIFALEVLVVAILEWRIMRAKIKVSYHYFLKAIGTFLIAFIVWIGDVKGWWCDPTNHYLQGHAIWHLLNALAITFLYRFYRANPATK